jgi:hypothetical protein
LGRYTFRVVVNVPEAQICLLFLVRVEVTEQHNFVVFENPETLGVARKQRKQRVPTKSKIELQNVDTRRQKTKQKNRQALLPTEKTEIQN